MGIGFPRRIATRKPRSRFGDLSGKPVCRTAAASLLQPPAGAKLVLGSGDFSPFFAQPASTMIDSLLLLAAAAVCASLVENERHAASLCKGGAAACIDDR